MATVYIVEVMAIYEEPGANVTNPRQNQINQDMGLAAQRSDAYAPGGAPPADEYLEALPLRYGAGWRARQFISVQASAQTLGQAVYDRLNTRNLKPGSNVQVFPDRREDGGGTGDWLFKRSWPAQPDDLRGT